MTCLECGAEKGTNIDCRSCVGGLLTHCENIAPYCHKKNHAEKFLTSLSFFLMHDVIPLLDHLHYYDEASYLREAAVTYLQNKSLARTLSKPSTRDLSIMLGDLSSFYQQVQKERADSPKLAAALHDCCTGASDIYALFGIKSVDAKIQRLCSHLRLEINKLD